MLHLKLPLTLREHIYQKYLVLHSEKVKMYLSDTRAAVSYSLSA